MPCSSSQKGERRETNDSNISGIVVSIKRIKLETTDKGKKENFDQSDIMGMKPHASIGPDRTTEETKVVDKLKKKKAESLRAKGSTAQDGEKANLGDVVKSIGHFVNR